MTGESLTPRISRRLQDVPLHDGQSCTMRHKQQLANMRAVQHLAGELPIQYSQTSYVSASAGCIVVEVCGILQAGVGGHPTDGQA